MEKGFRSQVDKTMVNKPCSKNKESKIMIPYVLQQATSSSCKYCHGYVFLLIEKDPNEIERMYAPAFYICFHCEKVFQVGVGEVEGG